MRAVRLDDTVLRYHEMSRLASPTRTDLSAFQEWLRRPTLGAVYLTGRDRDIWAHGVDLVSIGGQIQPDRLTQWFSDLIVPIYHRAIGRHVVRSHLPYFSISFNYQMLTE